MERFPNVYADTGCSLVPVEVEFQERYLALLAEVLKSPRVKQRLMYGSDFWLNKFFANSASFVDAFSDIFQRSSPRSTTGSSERTRCGSLDSSMTAATS